MGGWIDVHRASHGGLPQTLAEGGGGRNKGLARELDVLHVYPVEAIRGLERGVGD